MVVDVIDVTAFTARAGIKIGEAVVTESEIKHPAPLSPTSKLAFSISSLTVYFITNVRRTSWRIQSTMNTENRILLLTFIRLQTKDLPLCLSILKGSLDDTRVLLRSGLEANLVNVRHSDNAIRECGSFIVDVWNNWRSSLWVSGGFELDTPDQA